MIFNGISVNSALFALHISDCFLLLDIILPYRNYRTYIKATSGRSLRRNRPLFSWCGLTETCEKDKKKKNLKLFYSKTTVFILIDHNFVHRTILIIFVMENGFVKRISIWEKASDFFMDISKYVLTAVIITSAFEELSEVGWMMYLVGIIGAALFLSVSIVMLNIANKGK